MFKVTVRGLLAHKIRLLTTALAITLGVAFMAGTLVLTDTISSTFNDLFADVNKNTDAVVRSANVVKSAQGGEQRGTLPDSLLPSIVAVPDVQAADGFASGYAQYVGKDGKTIGNPGQGAPTLGFSWPDTPELNPFQLVDGAPPNGADEVVMDRGSATAGGFAVGDPVTVLTTQEPQTMTIVGIVTFGTADSPGGASVALFDLPTAQALMGLEGQFSEIDVLGAEGVSQADVVDQIRPVLPDGVEVITGEAKTSEDQSSIAESLSFFNTFLLVFALIALFVGSFIIYNTFSIIVAQRTREMALLRAVGANRRQVMGSVVGEAFLVGVVASLVGLLAGVVVASGLKALLVAFGIDIPATGTVITPNAMVVSFLVGVGITAVSAVLPARRASKVPPIAALRTVAVDSSGRSGIRIVLGAGVLVLGGVVLSLGLAGATESPASLVGLGAVLVFLGIAALGPVIAAPVSRVLGLPVTAAKGVTGRLATENASRNPKRTASAAAALMIGVGLVATIIILSASVTVTLDKIIDGAFTGDFIVDSGSFGQGGLPPEVSEQLAALPEVDAVASLRFAQAEIAGSPQFLAAFDPAAFEQVADIEVAQGSMADLGAASIAVGEPTAKDNGWAVGSTVPAVFAETGAQDLIVGAIYADESLLGSYVLPMATYDANFANRLDAQVYVVIADGFSPDQARNAIEGVTAAYPNAEVQDITQYKQAQSDQINQLLGLVQALLVLAIIIALLGVANTLALSIFERTRELGLMRAVGMTRRQVRSIVRWEAVIISLLGTLLGVVVGVFFGWSLMRALSSQGISELSIPVGSLVVLVVLAGIAGIAVAVLPARRASRLDILDAIASE